jgi:beta-galactosidase
MGDGVIRLPTSDFASGNDLPTSPAATILRDQIDLAGAWELAFDPAGEGIAGGWAAGQWPRGRAETVQVPALWERTHPDAEGVGFYRRVFTVPSHWAQRVLNLRFGGASYRAEVWLNGRFLGSHEGAYTPFWFDVTEAARIGDENELVVRVAGLSKHRDVDGQPLLQAPISKQHWFYTESGVWGDVALDAIPVLSIHDAVIEPDVRNETVTVEVVTRNADAGVRSATLALTIRSPAGTVVRELRQPLAIPPGVARFRYHLELRRPQRWSHEHPLLYQLELELSDGTVIVDRRETRFGMRDFAVRDGEFFLNDEPVFLRGVLLQPNFPVSLITPPTAEMMEREIRLMKEAGFNMIRAHIRPAPPGYLDLADEIGMLIYAESSLAWIRESPRWLDHGSREMRAMIERDRNHPSAVIWGIHNENRFASAATSDALIPLVRSLDPTRVVLDNSGGTMAIDQDFGWTDRTTVVNAWESERQPIQDLHIYTGAPVPQGVYEWLRTLGQSPSPVDIRSYGFGSPAMLAEWQRTLRDYRGKIFVSELGCGGMTDLDDVVAAYGDLDLRDAREMRAFRDSLHEGFTARGLDRVFGSIPELVRQAQEAHARGNTRQVEALLANPRVSGFLVTQLNDVAWEFHAGILDQWRKPKQAYFALERVNQPHCVMLKAADAVVTSGDRVDVALTLVQRGPSQADEQVVVTVTTPAGRALATERRAVPLGSGIKELEAVSFAAVEGSGDYRIEAQWLRGQTLLAATTETVLALPAPNWSDIPGGIRLLGASTADEDPAPPLVSTPLGEDQKELVVAPSPGSLSRGDWEALLAAADAGGVGVIGPLSPENELARSILGERGVTIDLHFGIGNWMGCYHWIPEREIFAGLPAGGLAGESYADVLPHYVMSELGGRVFAGSFNNTQTRREASAMIWYSDIEAIPFGSGNLLFCQYRLFDRAGSNPLAGRLLANLLRLAGTFATPD